MPRRSFRVDPHSGELSSHLPDSIAFKDGREIRPVAPFLEVFAITSDLPDELVPLTVELLEAEGLTLERGELGRRGREHQDLPQDRAIRRTGSSRRAKGIADHAAHCALGPLRPLLDE